MIQSKNDEILLRVQEHGLKDANASKGYYRQGDYFMCKECD